MNEVKRCPFCEREAELECWLGRKGYEACVVCDCGAQVTIGIYFDSQQEAEDRTIQAWNTRVEQVAVKRGKWIDIGTITIGCGHRGVLANCSVCGAEVVLCDYDNYCPACGADMVGDSE